MYELKIVLSRVKDLNDLRFVYDGSLKAKKESFSPHKLLRAIVRKFEAVNKNTQVRLSLKVVESSFSERYTELNNLFLSIAPSNELPQTLYGD